VRASNAVVLGTPENFGYMSGALKDFLERIYYVLLDETPGLPYALYVKASTDGQGAVRSVERIVAGLRWRAVLPPIIVTGDVGDEDLEAARELGLTMAAGVEAGIF
jgi:NAD(P)H-dependent FMN reductase